MSEEEEVKLPKRCPNCGGTYEDGYLRVRVEMRGHEVDGKRLQVYGINDYEKVRCLRCGNAYRLLVLLMDEHGNKMFSAGADWQAKREKP